MKKNEIKALHQKTVEELKMLVKQLEEEIVKIKMEIIQKKVKNTNLLQIKKDDLARVKTELGINTVFRKS